MKTKQQNLFDYFNTSPTKQRYGRTTHGGLSSKNRRKLERPLSTKKWIHLVLKSDKATGRYSFLNLNNKSKVESLIKAKARKFGIKLDHLVNVGNHLHLKIKISSRQSFQGFLRSITCQIPRLVTKARKGHKFGRFWQGLAFTRVLMSALEELNLKGYLRANELEATYSYQKREEYLKAFNNWVYREKKKDPLPSSG